MDYSLITYFLPLHDTFLATLAKSTTLLAEDTIIVMICAFIYWAIDPKKGQRLAAVALGGLIWSIGIKNYVKIPRPWDLGIIKKDQALYTATATGYSFPSAHTSCAASFYGYFATLAKKWWKVLLWAIVAFIGISRIFLGNHTSFDVAGALIISIVWLYVGSYLYDKLMPKNDAFIFIFYIPLIVGLCSLFTGLDADIIKIGTFGGVAILGMYLERRFLDYKPMGSAKTKAVELVIGYAVLVVLKFWPKLFGDAFYEQLWLKAVLYGAIAFWMSFLYPLILKKYNEKHFCK